MKALLLAGVLLATIPAIAQKAAPAPAVGQESPTVFKKANCVLVYTQDSAKSAIRRVAGLLQQRGHSIDRIDYDLLSITTKPKPFTDFHALTLLVIWDVDKLKFTGHWRAQGLNITIEEPMAYTNPASKKALAEAQAVAESYPGGRVSYKQTP